MSDLHLAGPGAAVQAALVAILRGAPSVAGLLATVKGMTPATPAVVDEVPEGQAKPYVEVGDHLSTDDDTHTTMGREITETLHIWTKVRSMKPGQDIANAIAALLHNRPREFSAALAPRGHRCVTIRLEFDQALRDPDPEIRHHILRFRIQTTQLGA